MNRQTQEISPPGKLRGTIKVRAQGINLGRADLWNILWVIIEVHLIKGFIFLISVRPNQGVMMCHGVILKNRENLQFVLNHFNNHEVCERALLSCPHMLGHISGCYNTQERCKKAIDRYLYGQKHFPD